MNRIVVLAAALACVGASTASAATPSRPARRAAGRFPRTYVEKCRPFGGAGKPITVGDFGFELVCASCLETRGVLESERLPEACPNCGARNAWKGPFAERFTRDAEQLTESPFYLGASRAADQDGPTATSN